jgi:hypothetical protein
VDQVIIKFESDISGLKPAVDAMLLLGKITDEDARKISAINSEQQEFLSTLNKTTTEAGKLTTEMEDLKKVIQDEVMAGMAEGIADWAAESKNAVKGAQSLKAELRELKKQIASGAFKGDELKQMTKRAAELTDHLGDVNDKIKALASDTKRIDAVVTTFRGLAAATSVVTGAMGLLGTENKDLEKQLLKVQSAMAILNGVQEVATLITTENAAKTLILDGAQKAVAVSARVMGTSIATASAVATGGLTLLVGAIAYLVTEMMFAEDEAAKLERKLAEFAANKELIQKNNQLRAQLIKDARERELTQRKLEYQKEKEALMESKADGLMIEQNTILLHKVYRQDEAAINEKYDKEEADRVKAQKERVSKIKQEANSKDLQAQLLRIRDEIANNEILERETSDISKKIGYYAEITRLKQAQITLDRGLTENEKILQRDLLDDQLATYREQFNKRTELDIASFNEAGEIKLESELDWWERYFEIEDRYNAELLRKRQETAKMWGKFAIEQAEVVSNTLFTIDANRRSAETNNLLDSLNTQRDAELSNKELTDAQKIQIEKRYQQQEAKIKEQAYLAQRNADIAQAIINGALAVGKTLAQLGFTPAGLAASVAAGVTTAAQIAIIQSAPIPKFEKGGLVDGQLHSQGGTIIEAEKGEYVINRHSTADYYPVIDAINNNAIDPTLANNVITQLAMGLTPQPNGGYEIDYNKLAQVFERGKSKVYINIDENGFSNRTERAGGNLSFRNSKLRLKA